METEYASEFKRIYDTDSVRKSFRDKVDYRKNRRQRENEHQSVLIFEVGADDRSEKRPHIDNQNRPDSIVISGLPLEVPVLELRPTPSPTPRRDTTPSSGLGSEESVDEIERGHQPLPSSPKPARNLPVQSRSTQTSDRGLVNERERAHARRDNGSVLPFVDKYLTRARSRSPFAAFGLGDRERTVSGKRTFNIKATHGVQVYETAVRAAVRKGYPLPQRSRKAEFLDTRKTNAQRHHAHHYNHNAGAQQPATWAIKKNVVFD